MNYKHQTEGIKFLANHPSAGLFWEMGTGKTRTSILAANYLFGQNVDQLLILCPAAVRYSWGEELGKLMLDGLPFTFVTYKPDEKKFVVLAKSNDKFQSDSMPVCVVSYGLLQSELHTDAIIKWADRGKTVLVCDESSFLKNRAAHRTKSAMKIAMRCTHRWLLTGTPVANDPLDLWAQGEVMSPTRQQGPLSGYANYYHFRSAYAERGGYKMKEIVSWKNLDKLAARFAPYVSRVEKKDCLDLPEKSYLIREVPLTKTTWRMYQELRKDALLNLGHGEVQLEPHAAVRVMRLCQLTSGYVGRSGLENESVLDDISAEKLNWVKDEIATGELSQGNVVVWCRWRRERERLTALLVGVPGTHVFEIYGGQSQAKREFDLDGFKNCIRGVMVGQPHAGGFGLDFTNSHQVVYMSNDFSYSIRNQSEDRCHRIGQKNPVTYIDILATGPDGQHTVDHGIMKALRKKEDIAKWTCAQWREVL